MKKLSAIIAVCSIGVAAQAQLIDDFSGGLGAYTLTKVLDQGDGTSNIGFGISGGELLVSSAGSSGAEQALFLRGDYSLAVGDMLVADVSHTGAGWDRDLGIAVSYSATPAGLASGVAGDVRYSYVEVSVRSDNQVVSFANDGGANLASGQAFPGNLEDVVDALYIAKTSATTFDVGWFNAGAASVLLSYTMTTDTPGAAVGFYADLRADLANSPAGMDNLRMTTIPEPTTFALAGLGMTGLMIFRRRR